MAKPGPKPSAVSPVKFGVTVYLVPGKHDLLIEWFADMPSNERWSRMRDLLMSALQPEGVASPELVEADQHSSELLDEILREVRRVASGVERLESSGITLDASQEEPPDDAPSEKAKAVTAKLFAKTRE